MLRNTLTVIFLTIAPFAWGQQQNPGKADVVPYAPQSSSEDDARLLKNASLDTAVESNATNNRATPATTEAAQLTPTNPVPAIMLPQGNDLYQNREESAQTPPVPLIMTTNAEPAATEPVKEKLAPAIDLSSKVEEEKPTEQESAPDLNIWKAASTAAFALLVLSGIAFVTIRSRGKISFGGSKQEKPMEILSTLPINNKRQILLVRIRDQEVALACTEQGITFLSDVGQKPQLTAPERGLTSARATHAPMITAAPSARPIAVTAPTPKVEAPQRSERQAEGKKSDILLNALKNIKNKSTGREATRSFEESTREPAETAHSPTSTLKQTRAFPKYLAQTFEQESKRNIRETDSDESVESVTSMIREKLKAMQGEA